MIFADLHVHTTYSDGTCTPVQLIAEAKRAGLGAIAVVDHDTVAGIPPSLAAGEKNGIEVIPGIELTAEHEGAEIHILGYLIDYGHPALIRRLDSLKDNRIKRIYTIAEKLNDIGIPLAAQDVFDMASGGTVGRLHVARAMVKKGLVGSVYEAFQKYIGDKCPAYVCGFRFRPDEAIQLISQIGGIPVIAHPYALRRDELIPQFVEQGLRGIEVHYPEHSQSMVNFYQKLGHSFFSDREI